MLERSEDDEAAFDYRSSEFYKERVGGEYTVDVDKTSTIADQSIRSLEEIIETDAETDVLDDFVCVFRVDIVLETLDVSFLEILWFDLD